MATTRHVLTPPAPLRAFVVSAGLAILGLAIFMTPDLLAGPAWLRWVGAVVLVLGLSLIGLALLAVRRGGVEVTLDPDQLAVAQADPIRWADVVKVTRATGRIVLYRGDGSRVALVVPRGGAGDLDALGADIARRLDDQRGYRPFT